MSISTASADTATLHRSLRLAFGTLVALPTTMTFLALSVAVLLGRSLVTHARLRPPETSSRA